MNVLNRKCFNEKTLNYLEDSFKKVGLDKTYFQNLLEWLAKSPKWSTLRVNTNLVENIHESVEEIQDFLKMSLLELNQILEKEKVSFPIPRCQALHSNLSECLFYESSKLDQSRTIEKHDKLVIIDVKCAQAIYRGADIFLPGIISLSLNAKSHDTISIFADLKSKCLKGSDANLYAKNNAENLSFIGNGWLLYDRDQIFKNSEFKSGLGVKIKELSNGTYIPSFDRLDESKYYPQNLPSIICAKVLDPKPGELILDMCAAPGGKTTHLAQLIKNHGRIIAFDKISSKISKMKELCDKLGATSVECLTQDATKINFEIFKPESFDRILIDAPCSALGQRPLIFNNIEASQLKSYINYQRMILDNAYKLLKRGGFMVYSTCTITIQENEEQVSWLLNKYKNMRLVTQEPFKYSLSSGISCDGLDESQLELLQRFSPDFRNEQFNLTDNVLTDTNGFFISKFLKE